MAASIALAAEQGRLSLDDEVRKHVPELPDYGHKITLRHLIHHSSGLRDYLGLLGLAGKPAEDVLDKDEVLALIVRQKGLNFPPGSQYLYSNSGYFLLAELLRRATTMSLREFAEKNIFHPLAMTQTRFHDDRLEIVSRRAFAYAPAKDGGFELNWSNNFDQVGSGGLPFGGVSNSTPLFVPHPWVASGVSRTVDAANLGTSAPWASPLGCTARGPQSGRTTVRSG